MKEYSKKLICVVLALCMFVSLFSGCGRKKYEQNGELPTYEPTTKENADNGVDNGTGKRNHLTGLNTLSPEAVNKKPVCIFTENSIKATSQRGISTPDIVVQDIDGDKVKYAFMYADLKNIPRVDNVSSPTGNLFEIMGSMDSIFVYNGESEKVNSFANKAKLIKYNMGSDSISDGKVIETELKKQSADTKIKSSSLLPFGFTNSVRVPFGHLSGDCPAISMVFSYDMTQTFKYNADEKVYTGYINNNEIKDGNNNNVAKYTNLILLYCQKKEDGSWDFSKGGGALYISNGYGERDNWRKDSDTSPLRIYGKDGKLLTINRGKTWIGIVDDNNRHMTNIER